MLVFKKGITTVSTKTIVIQQRGEASTQTSISEIETNRLGSGNATWVPQSDVNTGAITIKRNGTYKASETNYYAFSKVVVKSNGKAYGKKDGKKYLVKKDGEGYIYYVEVPDKLGVIALPNKTSYMRGEVINITGLRVVAQFADGTVYRELNTNELTISPATATKSNITVYWAYIDPSDGEEVFVLDTSFGITIGN